MKQLLRFALALGFRFAGPFLALAVAGFYYWYSSGGVTAPLMLADYCDGLRPGTPVEVARTSAQRQGFRIMLEKEGSFSAMTSVLMYQRSFCEVAFAEGKVTGVKFYTMD